MIISDEYRFVFIHIPKCAGTYVRNNLQKFDDTKGKFTNRIDEHEELGLIDYVHIPTKILFQYFREEFNKIRGYRSFAIVRDPFTRFPSSVSQRIRNKKKIKLNDLSYEMYKNEIEEIIDYLKKNNDINILPPEYIHFQRQKDYIYVDTEKIVKSVYSTEQIPAFIEEMENVIGKRFFETTNRSNAKVVYKNELIQFLIPKLRPLFENSLRKTLTSKNKEILKKIIFTSHQTRFKEVFNSDYVKDFIRSYYKEDIDLYNNIIGYKD